MSGLDTLRFQKIKGYPLIFWDVDQRWSNFFERPWILSTLDKGSQSKTQWCKLVQLNFWHCFNLASCCFCLIEIFKKKIASTSRLFWCILTIAGKKSQQKKTDFNMTKKLMHTNVLVTAPNKQCRIMFSHPSHTKRLKDILWSFTKSTPRTQKTEMVPNVRCTHKKSHSSHSYL